VPRSPLHAVHERLGARFTDFGGWEMPLQYEGTLAEHRAVRTSCGAFDVSHLGRFRLRGPDAHALVSRLLCNDIDRIEPGRAQYTMLLDDNGGVVDDIIVWWLGEGDFIVLPNAGNSDDVMDRFVAEAPEGTIVDDIRESTALIAVQGPDSAAVLDAAIGGHPRRFRVDQFDEAWPLIAAGTGYTGEKGAEVLVDEADATEVLDRVVAAGAVACGLGARDTLRLEMGYPLWGQDLDRDTTPLEAGLEWVVGWDQDFIGKPALERQQEVGLRKRLIGFRLADRRVPRHGYPLRAGTSTGTVSSGNFSPTLEVGIGMGYLAPDPDDRTHPVEVAIRGEWVPAERVDPPFVGD
jgi:aminomethyltransferase